MVDVFAHRGASAQFPENTVAAFEGAAAAGADGVELDVRRSSDHALVVCHDQAYGDGRLIVEHPASERPVDVPLLHDAIEACGALVVNVEIKNTPPDVDFDDTAAIAETVVAELTRLGRLERFLVSSFHLPTVDRVHALAPALPTALLAFTFVDPVEAASLAFDHGHVAIHPHDSVVDARFVDRAHALGLAVNVWTVDAPERIVELAALGVDGIVTNAPDVAIAALAEAQGSDH